MASRRSTSTAGLARSPTCARSVSIRRLASASPKELERRLQTLVALLRPPVAFN